MKKIEKPSFENCIDLINIEISKRKSKWTLSSLHWLDFDDVSQILRTHIYLKWHLYDPQMPLSPWLNRIISNQIKNLIRNNYLNYARPCTRCAAAELEDGCKIYKSQCAQCPLFAAWEKEKKAAYNLKIPVSLENIVNVHEMHDVEQIDIDKCKSTLEEKLKKELKPIEWQVYELIYIQNLTEEQAAKKLGYKSGEKNRAPRYKQIKNIQKSIIIKAKKFIYNGDIEIN